MVDSKSKGKYSLIASIVTSIVTAGIFAFLALLKNDIGSSPIYTKVDIIGGAFFVLLLTIIISASIWPGIIEKYTTK
ncbi:MAG: hypothetical protein ACLFMM_02930 [Methanohalobium sp.]|uniref:hypothetical protein n=1 Tax=Methanohalobium sp. TaxID=2837493 RepID=UPI00397822F7